jgi:integrase
VPKGGGVGPDGLPMRIARFMGLRIHECVRMGTGQAERFLKAGELTTKGKGGKVRTIPLNREAQAVLAEGVSAAGGRGKVFVPEGKTAAQDGRGEITKIPLTSHIICI